MLQPLEWSTLEERCNKLIILYRVLYQEIVVGIAIQVDADLRGGAEFRHRLFFLQQIFFLSSQT